MIDERINKTLIELERGLKNIESAREQVDRTISSYNGLSSNTKDYVASIADVSEKIKELKESIETDYYKKTDTFEKQCEKVTSSATTAIRNMETATEKIKSDFSAKIVEYDSFLSSIKRRLVISILLNVINIIGIAALAYLLYRTR